MLDLLKQIPHGMKVWKVSNKMRLDKFLKVTRIIKRRTVAKELADNGNITVNGEKKNLLMKWKKMTFLK